MRCAMNKQLLPSHGRWGVLALVSLVASLIILPASVSAASTAAAAPRQETIVFQISSGGTIYVVNPDGSHLRALTTGMDPALSPDGKTIAFTRWQGQTNGVLGSLWVINVDGTGERQVMGFASQDKSPTWSADGKQIVVSFQQGGQVDDTWMCIVNGQP